MVLNSYFFFYLRWILIKKGVFLLDVVMVFFKIIEYCLEVSYVILIFDFIYFLFYLLFLLSKQT